MVECLRRAGTPYVVIGAWALAIWGQPRATADLDLLVLAKEQELDRLGTFMTKAEVEVDETWQQWNPLLRGSQLRFQYRGVTIDLLLPRDRRDQAIFRRRQKKRLGRQYCWVVSSEDFILQKLKFGRPRDFEDVISVVTRVGDKLNRKYLRQWAGRLGVTAELDYILKL